MKTYIGRLRCSIHGDNWEHQFWCTDGRIIVPISLEPGIEPPYEVDIEITVDQDQCIVLWSYVDGLETRSFTDTRKDIALVRVVTTEDQDNDAMRELVKRSAKEVQDRLRRFAKGRWEVHCTGYVVVSDCVRSLQGTCFPVIKAHVNSVNPGHTHNYWAGWGGLHPNYCGHAWLGGRESWTYQNCGVDTIIHELFHNFGLMHSGAGANPYGERDVWQGTGGGRTGQNGLHMLYLGMLEPDSIHMLQPGESKRLFLISPECASLDLRPGEHKGVVIAKSSGAHYMVTNHKGNSIRVHRADPMSAIHPRQTWIAAEPELGSAAVLAEDIEVHAVRRGGNAIEVVAKWDKTLPPPQAADFPERPLPTNAYPFNKSRVAIWESVGATHQGFDLHIINNRAIGYLYTWDRLGDQRWYEVQGVITNNVAEVKIYTTRRKSLGADREFFEIGEGVLHFYDHMNGVLKFDTLEHGRSHVQMRRISTPAERNQYGVWGFANRQREGISAVVSTGEHGELIQTVYWYTYNVPPHQSSRHFQRWLMASGELDGTLTLYQPAGGVYNVKTDSKLEMAGECKFHAGTAQFEYLLDGVHGTEPLNRLV